MIGAYDHRIVLLSIVVAVYASYTALDLAGRVTSARKRRTYTWLLGGAFAMGTGIWSMHFVAMLAFRLPIAVGYDVTITTLSWLMAIMASGLALATISQTRLRISQLIYASLLMGVAICGMHYIGMFAMQMQPAITYDPLLFTASVLISISASIVALWICFNLRERYGGAAWIWKAGAAFIMGFAITGMHYTAMAAAHFADNSICLAVSDLDASWLAVLISVATFALLSITLILSVLDQQLESKTANLVESLRHANEELRYLGLHDPLTQLPNRLLLEDRIERCISRAIRAQTKFAVVYLDLDGFKSVNDSLGHHVGDQLLKKVAISIQSTLRDKDTVSRIGGDEFIVLLDTIDEDKKIVRVYEKIIASIKAISGIGSHEFQISASMGIAIYPDDGTELNQLLMHADTAMYAVKYEGKNNFRYFSQDMNKLSHQDFNVQSELRRAIRENELILYFQPKFKTHKLQMTGAEALVRWQHPEKGLLGPNLFIPVAEKFGIIYELDLWVLRQVCQTINRWQQRGIKAPVISINLSAIQFRQKNLAETIRDTLELHRISTNQIIFEITESTAMDNVLQSLTILHELNGMGVQVALDDFGTGYSSLSYLKRFPMQQLKIDRSFIRDIEDDSAIVQSIIALAHALKLQVVAEGVETEAQLKQLDALGCDEIQGFLMASPMSENEFLAKISRGSGKIIPLSKTARFSGN